MNINDLKESDYDLIKKAYQDEPSHKAAQEKLSELFDVSERTIRNWANSIGVGVIKQNMTDPKVLIYDIETTLVRANVFWSGKQYISYKQLIDEPKIITIAYKWLGSDDIKVIVWDNKKKCDEDLIKQFIVEYNKADMVVGINNNKFDNRWVNARAIKYNLSVNTFVKSLDVQREAKRLLRVPSYSMDYLTKYFGLTNKLQHSGLVMWEHICFGTQEEADKALEEMTGYNYGDIVATEELLFKLLPYLNLPTNLGVLAGEHRWACPFTGSENVDLERTMVTPAGSIQRLMVSKETGQKYKITNGQYIKFLEYKLNKKNEV